MSVAKTLLKAGSAEASEITLLKAGGSLNRSPLKPERFKKGDKIFDEPSNMYYEPTNQITQQNLVNQNRQLRATAKVERAAARAEEIKNTRRQQGNVVNEDQSIPLTRGTKDTQGVFGYQLQGNRNNPSGSVPGFSARGTVTPPERFGISREAYDANFQNNALSPFAEGSKLERRFIESTLDDSFTLGISKENVAALRRTNERILEAQETGSVVGLLRRQNELYNQSSRGGSVPRAGTPEGLEYGLLGNQISIMERNASKSDLFSANPEAQQASKRLFSGDAYDEAVHLRNNNATSTNAMNGGTSGPTPPSSSNMPIDPSTVPTGTTNYSGYYQPSAAPINGGAFGAVEGGGGMGIAASMGLGALMGGTVNYAAGGSFGEGAMMGGLAGGAIKIGSRAIATNQTGIENYLQRTALGSDMTAGMGRHEAAALIGSRQTAGAGAGFMQNQAFNILKSDSASMGMQTRYMVMGGSALSGVAFTGRRNDKRRGFNSHRGNRI